MRLVFDAGVVFSGAGWRGEAHLCLVAMARRRVLAFATTQTLDELRRVADEIGFKARHAPYAILNWYYGTVKLVSPAPLGKQRSRDPLDDPYLACALAAAANVVVSRDKDLLALEKPFGIEIITPRELLRRLTLHVLPSFVIRISFESRPSDFGSPHPLSPVLTNSHPFSPKAHAIRNHPPPSPSIKEIRAPHRFPGISLRLRYAVHF